jgi:hypothetical protein
VVNRPSKRDVFALTSFRWFFWGRTISMLGSAMTPVALAFAVLQARRGPELLGYVMAAEILPTVLMLLVGGSVADRYRRDRLLQWGSVGSGCAQAGIAAVVLTGANPYWLLPLAVANGVIGAVTGPATGSILPELVGAADVQPANAYLNAVRSVSKIVGPAAAGVLVATIGGGWAIALDAWSFFLAAACFVRLRLPAHPPSADSFINQMRAGWAYYIRQPWIWVISAVFGVMNPIQMGAWRVLGPILAERTFGAALWGVTLTLQAIGGLVGGFVALRRRFSWPLRTSLMAEVLVGGPMMVLGLGLRLPYLMAAALVGGVGSSVAQIAWNTALQQGVPKDKMARVMALDSAASFGAIPLGLVLAVPVAHRYGFRAVETGAGAAWMLLALLPLLVGGVRRMTLEELRAHGQDLESVP